MSLPITSIRSPAAIPVLTRPAVPAPSGAGFGSVLADAIGRVDQFQQNAHSSIGKFLSGEDEEVHKVALATQAGLHVVRPLPAGEKQSGFGLPGSDAHADVDEWG